MARSRLCLVLLVDLTGECTAAWRGYPQIVPPQNCGCSNISLGRTLVELRSAHAQAALAFPPLTVMTYGFPHAVALPTSNVAAAAEYKQVRDSASYERSLPSSATAASLSSLARVMRDAGKPRESGHVMMCPSAKSVLGTASPHEHALTPLEVQPCPSSLQSQHACHTVYMEIIRVEMLQRQAEVHNGSSGPLLAAFVETDQIGLGHPAALFASTTTFTETPGGRQVPRSECDLVLTVHERAPYRGNLNSAVQLLRNTPTLRAFWRDAVIPRTRRLASKECKGGQNQDATMAALGMMHGRLPPGSSRMHASSGLRVCALPYAATVGTPIAGEKVAQKGADGKEAMVTRERVLCPEQFLAMDHAVGASAGDGAAGGGVRAGGIRRRRRRSSTLAGSDLSDMSDPNGVPDLSGVAMLHLKASQRYPTHELAFALLHDCLTAATLAFDYSLIQAQGEHAAAAQREYDSIASQILWSRGARLLPAMLPAVDARGRHLAKSDG